MGNAKFTYEEGKVLFDKAKAMIEAGSKRKEALEEIGISPATWSYWKDTRYKDAPKVTVHEAMPKKRKYKKAGKTTNVWEVPFQPAATRCIVILTDTAGLPAVLRQL